MRPTRVLAALLVAFLGSAAAPADDRPFPPGLSTTTLEDRTCTIVTPKDFDPAVEHSMILVLDGDGGSSTAVVVAMAPKAGDDYVIVSPKAANRSWTAPELDVVKRIVAGLKKKLHVGEKRLHAVGFADGGWNLASIAFDETLRFQSVTFVCAGFDGGKLPKHAKKEMGVLALVGSDDKDKAATVAIPGALADKVRCVESHVQPGLGRAWPFKLQPYLFWWLDLQEGRFAPGRCGAFEWAASPKAALESAANSKLGAFVFWYSPAQQADALARTVEDDVTRDPLVQRFGRQLVAAKADATADAAGFAAAGGTTTPAFVIYDATGKVKTVLQGKVTAYALSSALRAVAPDKSLPKDQ